MKSNAYFVRRSYEGYGNDPYHHAIIIISLSVSLPADDISSWVNDQTDRPKSGPGNGQSKFV